MHMLKGIQSKIKCLDKSAECILVDSFFVYHWEKLFMVDRPSVLFGLVSELSDWNEAPVKTVASASNI